MDAITLEVMRNRFFAITEEMGAALIRQPIPQILKIEEIVRVRYLM